MSELERELKQYRSCMDHLRAPEALYTEVWNMTIQSESQHDKTKELITETGYTVPVRRHRLLPLVAAVILILAIGMVTYAAKPSLFGWGGNFVEVEDGRLWFIVNGEHIDITDEISETEPFLYEYTDEGGVIHYWLIGKNGPELENWGYGEYLYKPEENWMAGYSARTNLDPDSEGPAWLEKGKEQINFYW